MSLRDDILATVDTKVRELYVDEWNKTVFLRVLSGAERAKMGAMAEQPNSHGRFAAMVLCDEKGNRVFVDNDAVALGQKSGLALERILQAGLELNSLTVEAVNTSEKKSGTTPSADSGTVSP